MLHNLLKILLLFQNFKKSFCNCEVDHSESNNHHSTAFEVPRFPLNIAIGIGPPKTGSTVVNAVLGLHKNVTRAKNQGETWHFIREDLYFQGTEQYKTLLFDQATNDDTLFVEKTPYYAVDQLVPYRILSSLGNKVKFIYTIRNIYDAVVSYIMHCSLHTGIIYPDTWILEAIRSWDAYENCALDVASQELGIEHNDYLSVVMNRDFSRSRVTSMEAIELKIILKCGRATNHGLGSFFFPLTFARYSLIFGSENIHIISHDDFVYGDNEVFQNTMQELLTFLDLPMDDELMYTAASNHEHFITRASTEKEQKRKQLKIETEAYVRHALEPYVASKCDTYRVLVAEDTTMSKLLAHMECHKNNFREQIVVVP